MIFVFGSNEIGVHGAGAARAAREKHGAILQQGFGPQGNSFAIPTCHVPVGQPGWEIPFQRVMFYVSCFLIYANILPEEDFQVTQIGCGYAGWKKEQMAPLFANPPKNCLFDTEWKPFLGVDGKGIRYWGHF